MLHRRETKTSFAVLVAALLGVLGPFRSMAFLIPGNTIRLAAHAIQNNDHKIKNHHHNNNNDRQRVTKKSTTAEQSKTCLSASATDTRDIERNTVFVEGLMGNLSRLCDKYILNGSPKVREQIFNLLDQIAAEAIDKELVRQSIRLVKRAGVPMYVQIFCRSHTEQTIY